MSEDRWHFRPFVPADQPLLYQAFRAVYPEYTLSAKQFARRLQRIGYQPALSGGLWADDRLTCFIIHGTDELNGLPTAYNGGTGTLPGWRKQGMARRLYQHLLPLLEERGIRQIALEVATTNRAARQLYDQLGFAPRRLLLTWADAYDQSRFREPRPGLLLRPSASPTRWPMTQPGWYNRLPAIMATSDVSHWVAEQAQQPIGQIDFEPDTGRIVGLSVDPAFRRQGVGSALVFKARRMTQRRLSVINCEQHPIWDGFWASLGFAQTTQQWEMLRRR